MKELLAGIVLIVVLGFAAFFYRNALEHPVLDPLPQEACTEEARVCPDGSAVGRTGPNCSFSACLPPNLEDNALSIAFVVPSGYIETMSAKGDDSTLKHVFDKRVDETTTHNIVVRDYEIPVGETAEQVMVKNTMFETSGNQAESMKDLTAVTIHGQTFYRVTVERFEAQVHTLYYLPRAGDVLRFEILEKNVSDWTDPTLDIETLPEHAALLSAFGTLQIR